MDSKSAAEKIEKIEKKEIVDIRHHLKGIIWDILIDVYMPDAKYANQGEKETDARLEEIQCLMSKIEQHDILKFSKNLLQELEKLLDQEDFDMQKTFEEVLLNP
jgi:hypothetical protein